MPELTDRTAADRAFRCRVFHSALEAVASRHLTEEALARDVDVVAAPLGHQLLLNTFDPLDRGTFSSFLDDEKVRSCAVELFVAQMRRSPRDPRDLHFDIRGAVQAAAHLFADEQEEPDVAISEEERAQRAADADRIRHSSEMERGGTDDATRALQDRYVAGEITSDELMRLTREHVMSQLGR